MKKPKAPKPEELTDAECDALILIANLDMKSKQEKYLNSCKRMAWFCKETPTLAVPIVNEAVLLLRYAKAIGVTPTYERKVKAKSITVGAPPVCGKCFRLHHRGPCHKS